MEFLFFKFFFLLFISLVEKRKFEKIIKINFKDFFNNININNNENIVFNNINQENQFPILCGLKLDNNIINKKINIEINNEKNELFPISYNFNFNNEGKFNMTLYTKVLKNINNNCSNTLNLPYKFLNDENNIISKLNKEKIINLKAYGIEKDNILNISNIYFGGIPRSKSYRKYFQNCQINKKYSSWVCELNSISFKYENYVFINNEDYLSFNYESRTNLISDNFYKFLIDYPFKILISNGTCNIENYIIFCDCDFIKNKIISFEIHKKIFELNFTKFTKEINNNKCEILMKKNPKNKNFFILGSSFLENYITLFNYESEYITFISDKPFIMKPQINIKLLLISICCFILMFQIIYLSIILSMTIGCENFKLFNLKENGIFEKFNENRTIIFFN